MFSFTNAILIALIVVLWGRWLFIMLIAFYHLLTNHHQCKTLFGILRKKKWPGVSVIIPAYNEAEIVEKSLAAISASDYPLFEIIVVNDGSSDNSVEVLEACRKKYPKLRVLNNKKNVGKAMAQNEGIKIASYDYVVILDADTIFPRKSLKRIILPLLDNKVSGVTCNMKVGNSQQLLPKWQNIEYVTGLNIDRRTQSLLNCISVLSGAASAYRKSAIEEVGYFSSDTLTEDTDLTLTLISSGHKLVFEDKAVVYTEAPATVGELYRQRLRWLYGNLQCVKKHRGVLFNINNRALRLFGFPNFIFVNLLTFMFIPFYLAFCYRLFTDFSMDRLGLFLAAFSLDIFMAMVAYLIARERKRELLHCLFQRNFYTLFLGFVFVRVIVHFVTGKKPGWNKATRSGEWT